MAFKRSAVRSRLSPPSYHRKRRKPLKPYGFNGFSVVCKQSFLCFPVRLIFGAKALNQKDRKMKKIKMNHSATMTEPFDDGLSLLHGERPFLMPYGLSSPPVTIFLCPCGHKPPPGGFGFRSGGKRLSLLLALVGALCARALHKHVCSITVLPRCCMAGRMPYITIPQAGKLMETAERRRE